MQPPQPSRIRRHRTHRSHPVTRHSTSSERRASCWPNSDRADPSVRWRSTNSCPNPRSPRGRPGRHLGSSPRCREEPRGCAHRPRCCMPSSASSSAPCDRARHPRGRQSAIHCGQSTEDELMRDLAAVSGLWTRLVCRLVDPVADAWASWGCPERGAPDRRPTMTGPHEGLGSRCAVSIYRFRTVARG